MTREDLLANHIMCPQTKDIQQLKLYQDIGYTLCFKVKGQIIQLRLKPKDYPMLFQSRNIREFIITNIVELNDISCIDGPDYLLPSYISTKYLFYD